MRYRQVGDNFNVSVSRAEVEDFRQSWPCSGLPDKAICFQFSANGDLVEVWPGNIDGPEVLALSQDALEYAIIRRGER